MNRVLLSATLLAACTAHSPTANNTPAPTAAPSVQAALESRPNWDEARAHGVDFRAIGQEPGWMLDIHQHDHIVLLWDYGERLFTFPLADPAYPQEGLTRYRTEAGGHTLEIDIRRYPCQDAMNGEAFPARVEVRIDGRLLQGCGRSV